MEDRTISITKQKTDKLRFNEEIRAPRVFLVGAEGEKIGVVSRLEALKAAEEASLDLVEISPNVDPPVCRLLDYGKHQFQQRKKQAEAKKKQRQVKVKEIKFRPSTEEADYQVKVRSILRFLEEGDKVKITVRFRGRELAHQSLGIKVLERVLEDTKEYSQVEQDVKNEGRQLLMILAPGKRQQSKM